jgi:chemotaxis signal transduction protein
MDKKQYLTLLLGKQHVFLPLHAINTVLAIPTLHKTPDCDVAFKGILNFHGKGLPVYDLLTLVCEKEEVAVDIDTPLLLVNANQHEIGLLVSEVGELITVDSTALQSPPADAMSYVKYLYETEQKCAWILDLDTLVAHHGLQLKREIEHE